MKKIYILFISLIILLTGCHIKHRGHSGEHPELFTVAVNSLVTKSYIRDGEATSECKITKIEQDKYGRVLFSYIDRDEQYLKSKSRYRNAILISQFINEDKVYFYKNYNFMVCEIDGGDLQYINNYSSVSNPTIGFSKDEIDLLKSWNDWNSPISKGKCTSRIIQREFLDKQYGDPVFRNIYNNLSLWMFDFTEGYIVSTDLYGNMLIYVSGTSGNPIKGNVVVKSFIAILSKNKIHLNENYYILLQDDSIDYYLPFNKGDIYQKKLKELKDNNYWDVVDIDTLINNGYMN